MRKKNGQFDKGNPGGPGRPPLMTERKYLRATIVACDPEKWQVIVKRAVDDAKSGDAKAREWLSGYLLGKPEQVAPTLRQMAIDEVAGVEEIGEMDLLKAQRETTKWPSKDKLV